MIVFSLAAVASVIIAASSPFVGAWASVQTFGKAYSSGDVYVELKDKLRATVGEETVSAQPVQKGAQSFTFADGSRMLISQHGPASLTGEWIQPTTETYGEQYVTPIAFTAHGASEWSGSIHPVADVTHFYLTVTQNADGTLTAFLRNPETNAGARIGVRTLIISDNRLSLDAAGKPDITGSYDPIAQTMRIAFDGYPTPFTFARVNPATTAGFNPRQGSAEYVYHRPPQRDDGWRTASLTDVGMDPAKVTQFVDSIIETPVLSPAASYITSVSIARHGKLVLDEYFYGDSAVTPHDVRSAGKSVTTLMVGDAMADDQAVGPGSPLDEVLPQYDDALSSDARKQRITVADLMTMTSGLACDDNDDSSPGNEDAMQHQTAVPDWYRYTLALPVVAAPGSKAVYCSGGINVLGAVIAAATHESLTDFFYSKFAEPMQFGQYALPIMPPPISDAYMAGGGQFLPRDFLKFGQLILNGGTWNGQRIVDARFLAAAIAPHAALNAPDDYGYGWHLSTFDVGGVSYPAINAGGNGGQLLFVIPKLDMTVMITAANYGQYRVWRTFQTEPFERYLIPAATSR